MLTTLPPRAYLSSAGFRAYFLNMLGDIHYFLPGVFGSNPYPFVNVQLWTIPYELGCYLALVRIGPGRRLSPQSGLPGCRARSRSWGCNPSLPYRTTAILGRRPPSGGRLPCTCIATACPGVPWIFLASLLAMVAAAVVPHTARCLPIPLAYATVFLGTLNPKKVWPINAGDYSYGMYLYGFPMAQSLDRDGPCGPAMVRRLLPHDARGGRASPSCRGMSSRRTASALKPEALRFQRPSKCFWRACCWAQVSGDPGSREPLPPR